MSRPPDPDSGEGKDPKRRLPPQPRKAGPADPSTAQQAAGDDNQPSGLLDGLSLPEQFRAADTAQVGGSEASSTPVDVAGSSEVRLSAAPQEQLTQSEPTSADPPTPPPPTVPQPAVTQPTVISPTVAPTPVAPPKSSQPAAPQTPPGAPMVTQLSPMFPGATPFLARFLPAVTPSHTGIQTGFCNLHDFLRFLHDQDWYGFLHAGLGEQAAYVLVYEGRTVAAAGLSSTGEQALGELLHLYDQGAPLSAYPLGKHLAHILSGVGSRAWKFNLTDDFTGLHSRPGEAVFYDQGQVVATLPAGLSYEGAFPAPLRPQTLILPRSLAGWAHHGYVATLRGRDAVNAITTAHQGFRSRYGAEGLTFQKALVDGLTPAEFALRHDVALHDLEALLKELISSGYLKDD